MKPAHSIKPAFFEEYLAAVEIDDLIPNLEQVHEQNQTLLYRLPEEKQQWAYAPGKWTIKEIVNHLIDTERIMAYRALRFARKDTTELPGFDENLYAAQSQANIRHFIDLLDEYKAVRKSTIALFRSFNHEMMQQRGIANGKERSVQEIGYLILGHEIHHINVIKERYLTKY